MARLIAGKTRCSTSVASISAYRYRAKVEKAHQLPTSSNTPRDALTEDLRTDADSKGGEKPLQEGTVA